MVIVNYFFLYFIIIGVQGINDNNTILYSVVIIIVREHKIGRPSSLSNLEAFSKIMKFSLKSIKFSLSIHHKFEIFNFPQALHF